MVKKSRGSRARTRKILRQRPGYRPPITKFIQEFKKGQRVVISQEPFSQRGMPHRRFKGRMGRILDKRGKSYIIEIKDGGKIKKIISSPEHLKPI